LDRWGATNPNNPKRPSQRRIPGQSGDDRRREPFLKMKTDYTRKLTPEQEAALAEMKAAIAAYNGPITKIPEKKRKKESKPTQGLQANWSTGLDRYTWGG
jgi:hypothetical protein